MQDIIYINAQIQKAQGGFIVTIDNDGDRWGESTEFQQIKAVTKTLDEAFDIIKFSLLKS